jgi:hypothetical protein
VTIRRSDQIIVTVLSAPELYQVDPFHGNSSSTLIHCIPGATSLLGILELQQDVFHAIAGNWPFETLNTTIGSYSVWKIDMRLSIVLNGSIRPPAVVSRLRISLRGCSSMAWRS